MSVSTKPPRRWLQFRLRTLLLAVTLIAAILGWRMHCWRAAHEQQRKAINELKARGANTSPAFDWAEAVFSPAHFADKHVIFDNPQLTDADLKPLEEARLTRSLVIVGTQITDDGLTHLRELRQLELLDLKKNRQLTDAGLVHLEELKNLKLLILIGTQVTSAGAKRLQQELPNTKIAF